MSEFLKLRKTNCKNCYKCIRHCPVKSIRFSGNQAHIVGNECILCGQCFVVCPQNAKEIADATEAVKVLLEGEEPVVASIAPSFIANYGVGIEAMEQALRQLGFAAAEETAIGATYVNRMYEDILRNRKPDVLISSCCHSVNLLIQKHFPQALPYLADVISPMQAHSVDIRRRMPNAHVVFIGPCLSKKDEADHYTGYVDEVMTFEELTRMLEEANIQLEQNVDHNSQSRTRLFPTSGGILKTMEKVPGYQYISVDGIENCIAALHDLEQGGLNNCFIEMSACEGSCINGPVMREHKKKRMLGAMKVENYSGDELFAVEAPNDLSTRYAPAGLKRVMPGNEAIQEVLNRMGKTTPDKMFNCGCCGYPTCYDKAIAVCQGKAEIEMCLPYLKEKAESFSDKIIQNTPNAILVMDEDLVVKQINQAAVRLFKLSCAGDIVGAPVVRMLDPSNYLKVVLEGRGFSGKCHYVPEYKLFVDETVIYDRQYKILISIMRDVTDREEERKQQSELKKSTVELTDQVIEKQMRVVQEIASLLGETTAETKVALTKLKDAMSHDE